MILAAAAAISVLLTGTLWVLHHAAIGRRAIPAPTDSAASNAPESPTAPQPPAAPTPSARAELAAAFQEFSDALGAQVGLAYAPVDNREQVTTLGTWSSGPAWSTIKVPLSLALLRQQDTRTVSDSMRSAITASDNDAAERIWQALGAHETAAVKVQSVLAEAGKPVPEVPSEVTRPGFSVFGQTRWSLSDQVRFLAYAACDPRDKPVLDLMGEVIDSQRWGLGTMANTKFKGGWGPGRDGSYLVRQYGLLTVAGGQIAVAIAAVAGSGGFGEGTAVLSQVASWLQNHQEALGGGRCPGS